MHAQKPVSLECFSICLSRNSPLQASVSLWPHVFAVYVLVCKMLFEDKKKIKTSKKLSDSTHDM